MEDIWNLCSDKKIEGILTDTTHSLDEETYRLLFLDIFSRIKKIEVENLVLRILIMESGICDEEILKNFIMQAKIYLEEKDEEKAREMEFFSQTGISFIEWVNYMTKGKFDSIGTSAEK